MPDRALSRRRLGALVPRTELAALDVTTALGALLLGVAAFWLTTGGAILRPGEIGFLAAGDPAQHYVGWAFFRHAPWGLPPGANPDYGGAMASSIVFTDSIPLLALVCKPWSALLPEPFQYTGLWVLLCFCLQAWCAARLLARWTTSSTLRLLGAAFFVLAPPFLWRLRGHFALLGQWLILAALGLYLARRPRGGAWCVLLVTAALVHFYLFCMVAALGVADAWRRLADGERTTGRALLGLAAAAGAALVALWSAGTFMVGGALGASGYGLYRMNLLSPLDSDGVWSRLLPDVAQGPGDYEGFAFLGVGMLVLAGIAGVGLLWRAHAGNGVWRAARAVVDRRLLPLAVLAAAFTAFAVTPHLGVAGHDWQLARLPFRIASLLAVLRSSGRFAWPVVYLGMLALLRLVLRRTERFGERRVALFLGGLLALQLWDAAPAFAMLRQRLLGRPAVRELGGSFWDTAARTYARVAVVPPRGDDRESLRLARFAAAARMPIDSGYFARVDQTKEAAARRRTFADVLGGRLDPATLYVFAPGYEAIATAVAGPADLVGAVAGEHVLAPRFLARGPSPAAVAEVVREPRSCPALAGEPLRFGRGAAGRGCLAGGWESPREHAVWATASRVGVLLRLAQRPRPGSRLVVEADLEAGGTGGDGGARPARVVPVFVDGAPAGELRSDADGPASVTLPEAITNHPTERLASGEALLFVELVLDGEPFAAPVELERQEAGFRLRAVTFVDGPVVRAP